MSFKMRLNRPQNGFWPEFYFLNDRAAGKVRQGAAKAFLASVRLNRSDGLGFGHGFAQVTPMSTRQAG